MRKVLTFQRHQRRSSPTHIIDGLAVLFYIVTGLAGLALQCQGQIRQRSHMIGIQPLHQVLQVLYRQVKCTYNQVTSAPAKTSRRISRVGQQILAIVLHSP